MAAKTACVKNADVCTSETAYPGRYRGSGLARQLLEQAEGWCRSKGCTEIATDAELDNQAAQQFHERMGFEETYRIVEYCKKL